MLKRLIKRLKGQPDFYEDLKDEQVALYQRYFSQIIAAVDLTNNTKWASGQPYNRKRLAIDDETMERIVAGDAVQDGLSPAYLQVIVNQYFLADSVARVRDKSQWVSRVRRRTPTDYFPDPWAVRKLLES